MNTALLTNTLISNVDAGPPPAKGPPTQNTNRFALAPADAPTYDDAPKKTTTDNKLAIDQKKHINKPPKEFRPTLSKKTMTDNHQKPQLSPESKEPGQTSNVAEQPNVVQNWRAEYSLNVKHGKKGVATKVQPKAGYELAQLLAALRARKYPPATGPTTKPVEKEPLLTTDKGQFGLKTALPGASKPPTVGSQPQEDKSVDETQVTNKTILSTKGLTNQESGKELMPKSLPGGSKTANTSQKAAISGTSADSGSQKTSPLSGKELVPKATGDPDETTPANEKPPVAGKPVVSEEQKESVLNTSFPAAQDKPSAPRSRLVGISQEKSASLAEEPPDSKPAAGHQSRSGTPDPSLSSNDNIKDQGGNALGDSILKNLNPAQVQTSTNQTKDRSSTTSNNSSNSDFEQILSHNNAQNPITMQSSASAVAKTANNASPDNGSAGISEQILQSVNSSLRQGNQQITIHLNPPELGKVFIKFKEQQNQITGLLIVDKIQTRYEIQQALPQIIRNLADLGIQVKRLEVTLTDQPEQQAYKDQSLQDGWSDQQAAAEGSKDGYGAFFNEQI